MVINLRNVIVQTLYLSQAMELLKCKLFGEVGDLHKQLMRRLCIISHRIAREQQHQANRSRDLVHHEAIVEVAALLSVSLTSSRALLQP